MKGTFACILFSLISNCIYAQSNHEKFEALSKKNDMGRLNTFLNEWKVTGVNDPELYTACINYYYKLSSQPAASISKKQDGNSSLRVTDSSGRVAGYLNFDTDLNPVYLDSVFVYANSGIKYFPKRLDIRFGKVYILGKIGDYKNFTKEIIATVQYSTVIKNDWLWSENKKPEDPEKYMLTTIQAYLKQLYETEDDELLENMKDIGDVVLAYYPDNIEILSTTAVANLLTKNYDKALIYLKRAEKLNPKDFIVLNNIAKGYDLMGNKSESIRYYELTEKYGDDEAKYHAKKEIKRLKSE